MPLKLVAAYDTKFFIDDPVTISVLGIGVAMFCSAKTGAKYICQDKRGKKTYNNEVKPAIPAIKEKYLKNFLIFILFVFL